MLGEMVRVGGCCYVAFVGGGTNFGGNVGWQCLVAIEGDCFHQACYITLRQCLLTVSIGTTVSIELSRQPNHRVNGNYVTFCLLLYTHSALLPVTALQNPNYSVQPLV